MISGTSYLLLFLFFFVLTLFFWRDKTATYLRKHGVNADFVIPTFILSITGDLVKAVRVSRKTKTSLPVGVIFHGVFWFATIMTMLVASYYKVPIGS